jgi:hypothetical protein
MTTMKKSSRNPFIIVIILLFSVLTVKTQTFEEFAKQRDASFDQFKKEYEHFIKQMNQRYDDYVKQRDKEFTDYLNQRWEEYQVFAGLKQEEKPKPVVVPKHEPRETSPAPRTLPAKMPSVDPVVRTKPEPRLPGMQKTEPDRFPTRSVDYDFYGNRVALSYDPAMTVSASGTVNNNAISKYWTEVSKSNYNHLINQLGDYSRSMNLNDWGYYQLVRNTSQALYPRSENGARLMTWFLMNRSGYKARAAYYNNQVLLMLPAINDIYEVSYQTFNGIKYYLVEGKAAQIYTYDKDFPDATRIMDMNINSPLNLGDASAKRTVNFNYGGQSQTLTFEYCKNTVKFYEDYPLAQIHVYFNSAVSSLAKESLAETLMPLLSGKNEADAVHFLLNFTQNAFEYKTDDQQFGREKFFFAEEVLHYPYSDCEDRSVLFAYLARELLNMKVIGLEYHDHIATAVKFTKDPGGDYFIVKGEKYTICDPTYINAPVGLAMPEYASATAQIIELNNIQYFGSLSDKIWNTIYASGGHRAGNRQDLVFDAQGNAYVAGFFKGSAQFGNSRLQTVNNSQGAFLAKFSYNGDLVWVKQPEKQENATAYHVALDNDQNILVAGTFNNELAFGNNRLKTTGNADIFIAKFNPGGSLVWAGKAAVDTISPAMNYMFAAKYNNSGKHLGTDLYKENPEYNGYGISFDDNGNTILTGSSFANTGLNVTAMSYESAKAFDPIQSLKKENDRLVAQNYDPVIAGLFAAINLIKLNNVVIPGSAAQEALDRYNPGFRKTAPTVYSSISRINFMKNDQGVVLITTENRKSITIDYLRISNNASVKITEFTDGNAQLDVLSGISVGKAIVWYNLNFVRLIKDTGDMLFDYASDNTQRTFNLKEDILY